MRRFRSPRSSRPRKVRASGAAPLPLAFDLHATAGKNVRVRGNGYGAGLDIGVAGSVALAGRSPHRRWPAASIPPEARLRISIGRFACSKAACDSMPATACCRRSARSQRRASSTPIPTGLAIHTAAPKSRSASTDRLPDFKIALTSSPPGYTQDQILGLIAPFGGFINGHRRSRSKASTRVSCPAASRRWARSRRFRTSPCRSAARSPSGRKPSMCSTRSLPPVCSRRSRARSDKAWDYRASTSRSATMETSAYGDAAAGQSGQRRLRRDLRNSADSVVRTLGARRIRTPRRT